MKSIHKASTCYTYTYILAQEQGAHANMNEYAVLDVIMIRGPINLFDVSIDTTLNNFVQYRGCLHFFDAEEKRIPPAQKNRAMSMERGRQAGEGSTLLYIHKLKSKII